MSGASSGGEDRSASARNARTGRGRGGRRRGARPRRRAARRRRRRARSPPARRRARSARRGEPSPRGRPEPVPVPALVDVVERRDAAAGSPSRARAPADLARRARPRGPSSPRPAGTCRRPAGGRLPGAERRSCAPKTAGSPGSKPRGRWNAMSSPNSAAFSLACDAPDRRSSDARNAARCPRVELQRPGEPVGDEARAQPALEPEPAARSEVSDRAAKTSATRITAGD